jgi:hypothetical protein
MPNLCSLPHFPHSFPFLNFIGIFVVFALGADDVFVAVDKWKNARHELPSGTTEQIAALALPDAAYAMLLTSTTTAVAFFGTALCPVAPIVAFAVFCGLLIIFDYLMNIFLVFPALCLYDTWLLRGSKNPCINFEWCCKRNEDPDSEATTPHVNETDKETIKERISSDDEEIQDDDPDAEERHKELEEEKHALIHRLLDGYYNFIHKFRWYVLGLSLAGSIVCAVIASKLTLPVSSEVSILPDSNNYQKHRVWSQQLLSTMLAKGEGSEVVISWGILPADTGDHLNPGKHLVSLASLSNCFDMTNIQSFFSSSQTLGQNLSSMIRSIQEPTVLRRIS